MSGRAFSVREVLGDGPHLVGRITKYDLIDACERRWRGGAQDRPFSRGVGMLAQWIARNRHRDFSLIPPFDDGERIERILAGLDFPDDETVEAFRWAMALDGAWSAMGFEPVSVESFAPSAAREQARGAAPPPDRSFPSAGPAADLPAMGALGGPLPSGPICSAHRAAISPGIFILSFSAGLSLMLDEATARAARKAIDEGLAQIGAARAALAGEAA